MPSYNTKQLQEIDGKHHLHPFTNHKDLMEKGSRIITKADGVYLWDSDGNKIIDGSVSTKLKKIKESLLSV